jgi:hypothetical protein
MKRHRFALPTPYFGELHRHWPNARLNVSLRMMATEDNPGIPLLISLVRIGGQEVGHLRFQRLSNQLLGARPNQVRQRIISFSIFRLWFGTLLHRGVSPFVVEGGCFVAPISTRDAAPF